MLKIRHFYQIVVAVNNVNTRRLGSVDVKFINVTFYVLSWFNAAKAAMYISAN